MGNNKQFSAILDECLESLLAGNETVEQCLQRYPEHAAELEPLLHTAMLMSKAVDVKPSADFRAKARYKLQTMMAKSKIPQRTKAYVPRWAIAVCTLLLIFVLGGGTVLAADNSMPGNPLYGVKLVTENLSIKFAGSQEEKAELYATVADRRVTEMTWMMDNGKTGNLAAAAQRLNNDYVKISELQPVNGSETAMLASGQNPSSPSLAAAVPTVTPTILTSQSGTGGAVTAGQTPVNNTQPETNVSTTTATTAAPSVVAPVAPAVTVGAATVNRQSNSNTTVGNNNASKKNNVAANASDIAKLKNTLEYYAATHPEKIQALLDSDKVPESVKPALRRALAASKAGLQQAINNLAP